ncbi:hypothetical protein Tco_0886690 [Tanacetum coccineum]
MSTPVFAYLVGTDTESEPFKERVETEAPEIAGVRVPPAMSPGLSASMAEVAAMSHSTFCKSFWSSYKSSPSSSPPNLPSWKRNRGVESLSLGGDEAVPAGQPRAAPVVETTVGDPLGLGYGGLRCREKALGEGQTPSVFEVGQSFESGPESERPERVSVLSPALFEWYDRDIRELFTRSGVVRDEIFSQRYRFRSLKHEQERVAVTFGEIWRPVLALKSWAGQTDAQRASLWHAISDT